MACSSKKGTDSTYQYNDFVFLNNTGCIKLRWPTIRRQVGWGGDTVDGRNPANQLRLVVYPIIYKVLQISGGAGFLPSTVVPSSQMFLLPMSS